MSGRLVSIAAALLAAAAVTLFAWGAGGHLPGVLATAVLGASGLSVLISAALRRTLTVRLSRETVQRRLDAELPFRGTAVGVAYEVPRATVALRDDTRIEVDADVRATAFGYVAEANLVGSGVLAYRVGAFHLSGFRIEEARLASADPLPVEGGGQAGEVVGEGWGLGCLMGAVAAAGKALDGAGMGGATAFLGAKADIATTFAKERGGVLLTEALERIPVYRLDGKGARERYARLALQDVRVEDGCLVVDLNPVQVLRRT